MEGTTTQPEKEMTKLEKIEDTIDSTRSIITEIFQNTSDIETKLGELNNDLKDNEKSEEPISRLVKINTKIDNNNFDLKIIRDRLKTISELF